MVKSINSIGQIINVGTIYVHPPMIVNDFVQYFLFAAALYLYIYYIFFRHRTNVFLRTVWVVTLGYTKYDIDYSGH